MLHSVAARMYASLVVKKTQFDAVSSGLRATAAFLSQAVIMLSCCCGLLLLLRPHRSV
jgi:hypothetical protein